MAELPDIDTDEVSFIAYWNAIEQGDVPSDDWDATEVTSYGDVSGHSTYDNGVEGSLNFGNSRSGNFRAKSDGWLVVTLDDTEEVSKGQTNRLNGPWDICKNIQEATHNVYNSDNYDPPLATLDDNYLKDHIEGLWDNTSASDLTNSSMDTSDIGYYSYLRDNATNITLLSEQIDAAHESDMDRSYFESNSSTMEYESDDTIHAHVVIGAASIYKRNLDYYHTKVSVGGDNSPETIIADSADTEDTTYGVRFASNIDYAQDPGQSYKHTVWNNGGGSYDDTGSQGHQLIYWS